ncbi:hypothetical protein WJX72_007946 [[Myrmecia] bisecta]|uniref:Uncharacterized protein n=1 Tax=[Myrmecia] bisecta TaxID=41462 RepID=A0AAW1R833_9CHLO
MAFVVNQTRGPAHPLPRPIIGPDGTELPIEPTPVPLPEAAPHPDVNAARLVIPHGTEKGVDNCPDATVLKPAHRYTAEEDAPVVLGEGCRPVTPHAVACLEQEESQRHLVGLIPKDSLAAAAARHTEHDEAKKPPHAEVKPSGMIIPHGTEKGADNCPGATVLKPNHRYDAEDAPVVLADDCHPITPHEAACMEKEATAGNTSGVIPRDSIAAAAESAAMANVKARVVPHEDPRCPKQRGAHKAHTLQPAAGQHQIKGGPYDAAQHQSDRVEE